MRPLEGLLVLDFSTLLPGPIATLLLAEAGAEVVKMKHPEHARDARVRSAMRYYGSISPCSIAASAASRST